MQESHAVVVDAVWYEPAPHAEQEPCAIDPVYEPGEHAVALVLPAEA